MVAGSPRLEDGILNEAEACFLHLGHIEFRLQAQLQADGSKNATQFPQLAGIATGQDHLSPFIS
jgi:hypothetical protein